MSDKRAVERQAILIIEDEEPIRDMLKFALNGTEFDVYEAQDAVSGYQQIEQHKPALILLDWMLPGESGIDIARRLKKRVTTRDIPIILLTARAEEENKILGFDTGIDDYVVKPFSPKELIARMRAVLRRGLNVETQEILEIKNLRLDTSRHEVSINGEAVPLGPLEFRLLHFFMLHPDRAHSREKLLDRVWGDDVYVDDRTVDVTIRRLRKALKVDGHDELIKTIRGAGYLLSEAEV